MALLRMIRALFESPSLGKSLRRNMKTMLFFRQRRCGWSSAGVSLFRNSTGDLVEYIESFAMSTLNRILLPHTIVVAN